MTPEQTDNLVERERLAAELAVASVGMVKALPDSGPFRAGWDAAIEEALTRMGMRRFVPEECRSIEARAALAVQREAEGGGENADT